MESGHFYLIITDVDGKIWKFNRNFEKISSYPLDLPFSDFLSPYSESEFSYSLELMLGAPKIRRHLLLEHPSMIGEGFSQIWWEFSVITTPDMDISGIIGIGVGMQFLEQEMPWNNLVDVLGFGKITLDKKFRIRTWDDRITKWLGSNSTNWTNTNLLQTPAFEGNSQLQYELEGFSHEIKPKSFLIWPNGTGEAPFAAMLTGSKDGYHLFLVPKESSTSLQTENSLIPPQVLSSMPGAVFVLGKNGKLLQQNNEARVLGQVWKGRAYLEGYALNFPNQSNRFSKLVRSIEVAKNGQSSELEVKLLMPDQVFSYWKVSVKPVPMNVEQPDGIIIQIWELTPLKSEISNLNRENERLRDLVLSPSHILRGPLASMLGLLELIDAKQLDSENQKLFGYLKPLAKEMDQTIRQHAKKMSNFS